MTASRRDFLRTTAAGAGAVLAGQVAAPVRAAAGAGPLDPATTPRRQYKKAVKIGMVRIEGSLEDKFRLLKEIGYDGVELNSPSNLNPDEVLAAKEATGLAIPGVVDSVHWQKTLSHPDAKVRAEGVAGLETAIRDCHTYGGSTVLLVPAVVNQGVTYGDAYDRSQEEIQKVLPLCEELDVRIAFENVWNHFLLSPLEAARYVDEFESDRVGWYFDVGNIVNYGWPEHWVEALGERILKLDIKEFSRKKRDDEGLWKGFAVKLNEGDCNWPAVMKALDRVGYFERTEGWGTAEVGGGGEERLRDIAARMDRLFTA